MYSSKHDEKVLLILYVQILFDREYAYGDAIIIVNP